VHCLSRKLFCSPRALHTTSQPVPLLRVYRRPAPVLNCSGQHLRQLLSSGSCHLRHLSLASNRLQDEAALHIAACLPSCTALEHLDLSRCSIADKGLASLVAAASKAGPQLRVLKLWGNGFGGSSSQALHQLRQQRGKEGLVADVTTYVVYGVPCVAAV
jgi:hypothetical protein